MRAYPPWFALAFAFAVTLSGASENDGARDAAMTFGRALVSSSASALRPILPERGRVRLTLSRLGPEEGLYGAKQVEALFRDFLARGTMIAFEVTRCEGGARGAALAHGTAAITDREGRQLRIGVHLGFESEGGRWVLREVKETAE